MDSAHQGVYAYEFLKSLSSIVLPCNGLQRNSLTKLLTQTEGQLDITISVRPVLIRNLAKSTYSLYYQCFQQRQ